MGETISKGIKQRNQKIEIYMNKLQYVEGRQQENFGWIDIYRLKDPPYEYIMEYRKTFVQGDDRYVKYLKRMIELGKTQHKNLAKIHLTELREESHMCIKDKKVHSFCNYYNFNIGEAIKKKKIQQTIFTESELLYIMGCLLQVAVYLQNFGISFGQYRTQNIYLSPQEVEEENRHSCYYKALSEKETLLKYILSPEQLTSLSQLNYNPDYDIYKSDLFAITLVIFQLITQDQLRFYYNQSLTSYKFDRIDFHLDAVTKIYSSSFIQLLKICLNPNPTKRPSLQQALNHLNFIKKNSQHSIYCIRLHQDQNKKKPHSHKITPQTSPKPTLSHLSKLTPSPITTLSSSTSSNFKTNLKSIQTSSIIDFSYKKSPSLSSKTSQFTSNNKN